MSYSYQYIDPVTNEANGVRFFSFLKTTLGADYKGWLKHPDFDKMLQIAHNTIFNQSTPFKKGGGLQLQVCFLIKADEQNKATKQKRANSYHDALMYAVLADVVSQEFYLQHRQ